MQVLVTGATGFVGRRLVPALLDAGHTVTVLVRDAEKYDADPAVTVVEGDLLVAGSFEDALDVDAAYYLVHSMGAGTDFGETDRRAAKNFAAAASTHEVDRVVYLGGLGADADDLSPHLESRREVERVLGTGTYALTTLRAGIIIGAGSISFDIVRDLAEKLPVMVTPRWVQTPCQPIAIDDVIAYLVAVLDAPETVGDTFEIGGPDVMTYGAVLERTGAHIGRRPILLAVPVLTPRLSTYWVELVTDADAHVARALIEGLRNPVVVTDDRLADIIPFERTSFDEAVERALGEDARRRTIPVTRTR